MLDIAIQDFLEERKSLWLKKKIKNNTSEADKQLFEQQAANDFSLAVWLPNAAKRAWQLSLASHPSTFSHPSVKTSPVIALADHRADGFLRSGNVQAEPDVFGNAAALDVYTFLSLPLADKQTVLSHLEQGTEQIRTQFTLPDTPFAEIEQGLLAIKTDEHASVTTSGNVKQVYFPIGGSDYHLLSVLTPSNLMYKLKQRINEMRFSDKSKISREKRKKNLAHDEDYSEVFGLSVIGFGGTKPRNISVLNKQNKGAAYLLSSMPPTLVKKNIIPPKHNFFVNSLWLKKYEKDLLKFHQLLAMDKRKNKDTRNRRDHIIERIIDQIIERLWQIRRLDAGWSDAEKYQQLPGYQKIWLDQQYLQTRAENDDWLEDVKKDFVRWFYNSYESTVKNKPLGLDSNQAPYFKDMIDKHKEALL